MNAEIFVERRLALWTLEHAHTAACLGLTPFPFTLQGFGMLRAYVGSTELRLHVWDDCYAVPGVSELHTHPWHMESLVLVGQVRNQRFEELLLDGVPYRRQTIRCGEGGGLRGGPEDVLLGKTLDEVVYAGQQYCQTADEIHRSIPERGTITLVHRVVAEDADHAYVYWPADEEWVSAEPRKATAAEVADILSESRRRWGW